MSKHTPGPWHSKNCSAILAPDGKSVASTNRRRRPDYIGNAYLIAAAPSMYDALTELVRAVDADDGVQAAIAFAETVLEKVEGREVTA